MVNLLSNHIRTPRPGVTEKSRQITKAVDNEDWQQFRLTLKGTTTLRKLQMLSQYIKDSPTIDEYALRFIRVTNYHRALCRGGQLAPGIIVTKDPLDLVKHIRK